MMRLNRIRLSVLLAMCVFAISGCAKSTNMQTEMAADERRIVQKISAQASVEFSADSMYELFEYSDFVAEILVTESMGRQIEGTHIIYTDFRADILTLYKGTYSGETFSADGGYVEFDEYVAGLPEYLTTGEYDETLSGGYVYFNSMEGHIPEVGETVLFFGKYAQDDPVIYASSPGQSIYLCDDDFATIHLTAESVSLQSDLQKNCAAEITPKDDYTVITCDKQMIEAFLNK